jgi:hypothetical protein
VLHRRKETSIVKLCVCGFTLAVALVATPRAGAAQTPPPTAPGHDHQQMMTMSAAPLGFLPLAMVRAPRGCPTSPR